MKTKFLRGFSACILLVASLALPQRITAADSSTLTKVGDKSPVLSVRTIGGQDVDFRNKVVGLNFFFGEAMKASATPAGKPLPVSLLRGT